MASLNKVTLLGALGADPDVRNTQDGRQIVTLRVATSETWKDKATGEKRDKTEWHTVVVFSEGLARIASQYLRKGSKVYIEGALQTRKWQDKDGNDRYSTEIVLQGYSAVLILLSGNEGGSRSNEDVKKYHAPRSPQARKTGRAFEEDLDDSIPF